MTSNAKTVLARMMARKQAVVRELEVSARVLAPVLVAESKKILQTEIYNVPIPLKAASNRKLSEKAVLRAKTTKGSHGKWMRTGNLKRGETASADGVDVLLTNNAEYSAARNALGGPNPPNAAGRKAGTQRAQSKTPEAERSKTRSVQWQKQAIETQRERILQERREGVLRALKSP